MNKTIKILFGMAFIAMLTVSCQKDTEITPQSSQVLSNKPQKGGAKVAATGSLTGNCATPSGGSWGLIDYNLTSNTQGLAGEVEFFDRFNASIRPTAGYYMFIYDALGATPYNVSKTDVLGATHVNEVGHNANGLGWYNYGAIAMPTVQENRLVIVANTEELSENSEIIALQLNSVGFTPASCAPGQFKGLLSFEINTL